MKYPINYPFSRVFAKLGAEIIIRVDFIHDKEANVFVATSQDIKGLVVEAETYEQLQSELKEAIATLSELSNSTNTYRTNVQLTDHILSA